MIRARTNAAALRRVKAATVRVENDPRQYVGTIRPPRLAAASIDLWCQLSASLDPATGTWPSITATSTTADVYTGNDGSLTLVQSGATIYNRRNVTWSASKTTALVPTTGGYAIIDQDC